MLNSKTILIRADTNSIIGMGHISRMIALGQLCQTSGFEVHYIFSTQNEYILKNIYDEGFIVHNYLNKFKWNSKEDQDFLANIANQIKPNWIVLDGEHFGLEYEKFIVKNYKLLRIVDFSTKHTFADILLDQNFGAEKNIYSVEPHAIKLLGMKYLLIRKEFRKMREKNIKSRLTDFSKTTNILVTLGGGSEITDLVNYKIIKAISRLNNDKLSFTLILGPFSQKFSELKDLASSLSSKIKIEKSVNNMAKEMQYYSFSIISGGSIMWESIYMNMPFMAIALTKKQEPYLENLSQKGLCFDLGFYKNLKIGTLATNIAQFVENQFMMKKNIYNFGKLNFDQNKELITNLNRSK
jgi:UDP-2,4-diacetamido-2,4,6-trideoxy-beta-L-altropyranose hydrolase